MRNSILSQRIFWINSLGSLFSYNFGNQTLRATDITIPDPDIDAEDRKNEYHFTFPNGDVIPCKDCLLEIFVDEFGNEFHRELVTEKFIFYVNREESDENGSVKMFRKETLECVADNYFAFQAFNEAIEGDSDDQIMWRSEYMNDILKQYYTEHVATGIQYDTDGDQEVWNALPAVLTFRINREDFPSADDVSERISDLITEQTSFCHNGFSLSPEPQDKEA